MDGNGFWCITFDYCACETIDKPKRKLFLSNLREFYIKVLPHLPLDKLPNKTQELPPQIVYPPFGKFCFFILEASPHLTILS